ncbi:MAG: raffinose/stachyose/melibiose transport system permease protein [Fusobacteriaceae bacterium]|jgi:raffinose/stachyose/melibiose transport system permease protein|nr:sugar transporter permease [Fusobacteriales bacterium]MDN5305086.1 raffinose/stachyose/melibiose transport system permease protein [Fusobacteriaceae bacterium]
MAKKMSFKKYENITAYMFLAPLLLLMSIFVFYGVYFVIKISFYKWDGVMIEAMKFRGLRNYQLLFTDKTFWKSVTNVSIFMILTISVQMILGLIMAVLLKPKLPGHPFFKALFYIPAALSTTVIARIFMQIYEPNFGMLNQLFRFLHMDFLVRNWVGDPNVALYAIIIANIFQWTGAQMVFYIAGLTSISEDVLEAAQIDGAGFWTTFFKIIFPMLIPTHTTVIILGMIGAIKTFDIVWLLTQGGPGNATQFLATYLYKYSIVEFKAGYGATVAVVMIVMSVGLSMLQNKIYDKTKL